LEGKIEGGSDIMKPTLVKKARKYSDTKFDNPDFEAKIEQQTLQMLM